jgi:hypothetical protein
VRSTTIAAPDLDRLPTELSTTERRRSWHRLELRLPNAAAQTRIVSVARIRLDSRKSVRPFKGIICADISEFESYHLSHAVWSPLRRPPENCGHWELVKRMAAGGLSSSAARNSCDRRRSYT